MVQAKVDSLSQEKLRIADSILQHDAKIIADSLKTNSSSRKTPSSTNKTMSSTNPLSNGTVKPAPNPTTPPPPPPALKYDGKTNSKKNQVNSKIDNNGTSTESKSQTKP